MDPTPQFVQTFGPLPGLSEPNRTGSGNDENGANVDHFLLGSGGLSVVLDLIHISTEPGSSGSNVEFWFWSANTDFIKQTDEFKYRFFLGVNGSDCGRGPGPGGDHSIKQHLLIDYIDNEGDGLYKHWSVGRYDELNSTKHENKE